MKNNENYNLDNSAINIQFDGEINQNEPLYDTKMRTNPEIFWCNNGRGTDLGEERTQDTTHSTNVKIEKILRNKQVRKVKRVRYSNPGKTGLTRVIKLFIRFLEDSKVREPLRGKFFDYFRNVKDPKYFAVRDVKGFFLKFKEEKIFRYQQELTVPETFKLFLNKLNFSDMGKYGAHENRTHIMENKLSLLKIALGPQASFDDINIPEIQPKNRDDFNGISNNIPNPPLQKSQQGLNDNDDFMSGYIERLERQTLMSDLELPTLHNNGNKHLEMEAAPEKRNDHGYEEEETFENTQSEQLVPGFEDIPANETTYLVGFGYFHNDGDENFPSIF